MTGSNGTPLRSDYLAAALDEALSEVEPTESRGRVLEAVGTLVKATGLAARIGDLCELRNPGRAWRLRAQVIGVSREGTLLMPFGQIDGISAQTEVITLGRSLTVRVGPALLGRVLDGVGEPRDGLGPLPGGVEYPVHGVAPDPLTRRRVDRALQTGVRAIDGFLTCGEGQRVGIFAPAGTGKSCLLSMIARGTSADVIVVGLIGERGREVGEFLDGLRQSGIREHCVCVVATSDRPAVERIKAANVATSIAEYFRDQRRSVLLLVDSVTRYARALREIGLASGEPPTRRGYPPSALSALPGLFERAGQSAHGSITAFYTVLVDDDEGGDPIAEEVRATLDGHIVLSSKLAASGHFPAIDVPGSRSRVMAKVASADQQAAAIAAIEQIARYESVQMLVQIGEYKPGSDVEADRTLRCRDGLMKFMRQQTGETSAFETTLTRLRQVVSA